MRMATAHRKVKKRTYRALWIVRMSAACRAAGITYSRFVQGMTKAKVGLNRKMLAEIAVRDPESFTQLVAQAKSALA
jgi:large subunit ribosomal protein L20